MPYRPGVMPPITDVESLRRYVEDEFRKISQRDNYLETPVLHAEPTVLRAGMIAYADGTDWDPGSGEGLYVYESGGWVAL